MTPSPFAMLGGTFDPVHYGHLRFADELPAVRWASRSFISYPLGDRHCSGPVASAADRLAMLRLAVTEFPGLVVDSREVDRAGKSYTVLTLDELRHEDPQRPLLLLVGADAFRRAAVVAPVARAPCARAPGGCRAAGRVPLRRPAGAARRRACGAAGTRSGGLVFDAGRRHLRGARVAATDLGDDNPCATRTRYAGAAEVSLLLPRAVLTILTSTISIRRHRMRLNKLQKTAVTALEDIKARDIRVLDVRKRTSIYDSLIIASAESDAAGEGARRPRARPAAARPAPRSSASRARRPAEWVLVDCGDIVVHVMQPAVRAHYNLEELWETTAARDRVKAAA